MARENVLIGALSSRVPGTNASIDIPRSATYYKFWLNMTVATVASITRAGANKWSDYIDSLELRIGGDTKIDLTPTLYAAYLDSKSLAETGNVFELYLGNETARTAGGEDFGAYGTADLAAQGLSFDMIVKLKGGAHVIDKLDLYAERGPNTPLGMHTQWKRWPENAAAAGEYLLDRQFQRGDWIEGMAFTTSAFDKVKLEAGQTKVHETTAAIRAASGNATGKTITGDYIDLQLTDRHEDHILIDDRDWRMTLTMTAGAAFEVGVKSLGQG